MEVSGSMIRRSVGFRCGVCDSPPFSGKKRCEARRRVTVAVMPWADESHRLYYAPSVRCGAVDDEKRKEVKMRGNLVTEISRDLAALYSTGLVVDGKEGMHDEIREARIMEAAEFLLTQLKQRNAKEKEMKKKNKVLKGAMKAAKKAAKMRNCAEDSSSSSSSESSDSECEEVVEMNRLTDLIKVKCDPAASDQSPECSQELLSAHVEVNEKAELNHTALKLDQSPECSQELLSAHVEVNEKAELNYTALKLDQECSSSNGISSAAVACCPGSVTAVEKPSAKIEVCMGGKCKKAGSIELLQEFQKKVGIEGAVVGCKCMGKCKQGPNVRVVNHDSLQDGLVEVAKKPLCIGVGLEDVSSMVANFFGEEDIDMGLLVA